MVSAHMRGAVIPTSVYKGISDHLHTKTWIYSSTLLFFIKPGGDCLDIKIIHMQNFLSKESPHVSVFGYSPKLKKEKILLMLGVVFFLSSCSSGKMLTSSVAYQSIRTTFRQPDMSAHKIPDNAEIILAYTITPNGNLSVGVINNTQEIMVIDQTMSFFINNGRSVSYYDPTIKSRTVTDLSSETQGVSVNVGAIGNAFGIGGRLGGLLNGINLGSSGTTGTSIQNTTVTADQPRISIGPKGSSTMSKTFKIDGVGKSSLKQAGTVVTCNKDNSYCKFSVSISYSLDGGNSFKKITTDFYANSKIVIPVNPRGMVNETLRSLFATKTDALNENLWILHFNTNIPNAHDCMVRGFLYDYQ